MKQKFLSGLAAALLVSLGSAPSGYADPSQTMSNQSGADGIALGDAVHAEADGESSATHPATSQPDLALRYPDGYPDSSTDLTQPALPDAAVDQKVSSPIEVQPPVVPGSASSLANGQPADTTSNAASNVPAPEVIEVIKVGAYQSQATQQISTVATIESHALQGRQAATLYVRNIPVLTFLGAGVASAEAPAAAETGTEVKIASIQPASPATVGPATVESEPSQQTANKLAQPASEADSRDPIWRATAAAARLNQLHQDSIDASEIKIIWDAERRQYLVKANEVEVVAFDGDTVLPDTVESSAGDLLQATNRIRRQMGNAKPLSNIEGDPNGFNQVSIGPISLRMSGYASWYGPGFDGGYSASGEVFNQEALTAAHPSLPFGTQIRVTNMDNGESVVVRVTDRGPYAHGRVIDLSTGAARVIGLIHAGVAPVSLEVLGAVRAASN